MNTTTMAEVPATVPASFIDEMVDSRNDVAELCCATFDTTYDDAWRAAVARAIERCDDDRADDPFRVMTYLLANPHTPPELIDELYETAKQLDTAGESIRSGLFLNKNVSDARIREAVELWGTQILNVAGLMHDNTPMDLLIDAVRRDEYGTAIIAARVRSDFDDGAGAALVPHCTSLAAAHLVASGPHSDAIYLALCRHPYSDARRACARVEWATTAGLELLSSDADIDVRERVASNPNTPSPVLEKLLDDDEYQIVGAAYTQLRDRGHVTTNIPAN